MKKIILTGAASSIGIAIINKCIKENVEVLAFVNRGSMYRSKLPKSPLITVREATLDEYQSLDKENLELSKDFSGAAFIHLAWAATAGDDVRNLVGAQAMNIKYSLDAVELAEKLGCSVFVGAGSQAEYGRRQEILTEDLEPKPETAYGMAKLSAGQLTRLACRQKGIKHIWPRILSAYGPECPDRTVVNYSLIELINGRSPELTGCQQIWDFIYIDDVAKALLHLVDAGENGEIYLIGSGHSRPLKEYLDEMKKMLDDIKGENLGQLCYGAREYGESTVMHLACSIDKLTNTGYKPDYSFAEGMDATIRWMLAREK